MAGLVKVDVAAPRPCFPEAPSAPPFYP